ncbi:transport protein of outer membrane lipoproteins (ABC superfamily, membrane) [Luminiphilus syltensis NOR5-1B]|uniref:Transport protein of outer membrane lipoproteins (ABC superfamily, membrane) n=1 Tax=Luminiphilus syltensis NOR5-1B TaxID=565045 RepID=B8KYI9_9GAMM|nr:lipoprotein-releasing ABC transporter permease subunit [Luminiphilus syltensis]EED36797.1 transport protein of outer membrane lipoproteins (ABC superfamily, membrane) [Luminiphilus syltensis NOR5-1B]
MTFVSDIALRYGLSRRQQRFTRVVALVSTFGMVLGVASLITVMSIMNGFSDELHNRILAVVPHGKLTASSGVLTDWPELKRKIMRQPGIKAVAPYIDETVLMQAWGQSRGSIMKGIDLEAERDINQLHTHIVSGSLNAIEERRFTVALGQSLARLLGVSVGDSVIVTVPSLTVTPLGLFPRIKRLEVVAEFEVGAEPDASHSYVSLETAQRLLGVEGVQGLQLRTDNLMAAPQIIDALGSQLPSTIALSDWRDTQGSLFTAVQMEKVTVALLLLSVIAVAAFNIVSTLTMSVTEKRSDIAVMRVLGARSSSILGIFIGYGMLLGVIGVTLGAALGVLLSINVSDLAVWIEQVAGVTLFDPTVYYIGRLPARLLWDDVIATVIVALLLSLLSTLYPAWRASRISPVEVLNRG